MNLWKKLRGLKKIFFETHASSIDNYIFKLHYKVTVFILVAFSILVITKQLFGVAIDCLSRHNMPKDSVNILCWVHTTFSLSDSWEKEVGNGVPYPGVGKHIPSSKRVYHAYYPWVGCMLFLQGIFFCMPRCFWKAMEGSRIKNLIFGLNSPVLLEDTTAANRKMVVQYLVSSMNNNNAYFMSYAIAEIVNFINVLLQFLLTNSFLGGEFSTYGLKVIQFTEWDSSVRYNPMIRVFPRVTMCTYNTYGSSGDVHRYSVMCTLPNNMVYEKIYVFLWFWFVFLGILSGLVLLYRAIIVFFPKTRLMVTRSRARLANKHNLKAVINKCKLGDWFLLDLLSKNLDELHFRDVINDFALSLDEKNLENVWSSPPATNGFSF